MTKTTFKETPTIQAKDAPLIQEDSKAPTLSKLEAQFLDELRSEGKSANTLKNYRTDLECFNQFLEKHQGHHKIEKFDIPQTLEYGKYLEERYASDNSRRRRVQALRRFFDFLVGKGHFSYNPIKKIPTSPKFLDVPRPTPLKDIQTLWQTLIHESRASGQSAKMTQLKAKRNMVLTLLIYGAGLKVSDLTKLKVSHVSFGSNPRVQVDHPKREAYTIPLPSIFGEICKDYLDDLEKQKSRSHKEFDHLFFNANAHKILSGGITSRGLEVVFKHYRNQLKIVLTPKSLRQSCIFKWLQQGHPDSLIKEWMGVSPSYSLKLYKDHQNDNVFSDEFLSLMYQSK